MANESWAQQGWDAANEPDSYGGGGGGGQNPDDVWDFFVEPGQTKRVLILDDVPYCFWQHGLYEITRDFKDTAVCLDRNKIDDRGCPVCKVEAIAKSGNKYNLFPHMIGYFTVIDMGEIVWDNGEQYLQPWKSKKGKEYSFVKRKLGAKKGSEDKPGMLRTLAKLAQQRCGGYLGGTVWDVTRSGKMNESIGNQWEYKGKIPKAQWKDEMIAAGADSDKLDLTSVDWAKQFAPSTYDELMRMCGDRIPGARPQGGQKQGGQQAAPQGGQPSSARRPVGGYGGGSPVGGQGARVDSSVSYGSEDAESKQMDDDVPF